MNGIRTIAIERDRQVEQEGWDDTYVDALDDGSLVRAAIAYAHAALGDADTARGVYPWDDDPPAVDQPEHVVAALAAAGALIAAEIDRIGREFPDQAAALARAISRGAANGTTAEQIDGIARPWVGAAPASGALVLTGDFASPPSGVQVVVAPGVVATYLLLGWDTSEDDDGDGTDGQSGPQHPAAYL